MKLRVPFMVLALGLFLAMVGCAALGDGDGDVVAFDQIENDGIGLDMWVGEGLADGADSPGETGDQPGDGGTNPGDVGTNPGDGGTNPGDDGGQPCDGGATLEDGRLPDGGLEPCDGGALLDTGGLPDGTLGDLAPQPDGPELKFGPAKVDFGEVSVGSTSTKNVDIINGGVTALSISGFAIVGDKDFGVEIQGQFYAGSQATAQGVIFPYGLVIEPGANVQIKVSFAPSDADPASATLNLASNDATPGAGVLALMGNGGQDCQQAPTPVADLDQGQEVIPQTRLTLNSTGSTAVDSNLEAWLWEVVQPVGSQSAFEPGPTFPNTSFEVNVAGEYTFYLTVWDSLGRQSCTRDSLEVVVIPDEAVHVELLWDTPGDADQTDEGDGAGADLDLHFAHPSANMPDQDGDSQPDPWFDQFFDCYWFNVNPMWGSSDPDVDDDPSLDRDDTDGAGPENLNLSLPENGKTYTIGVHYWNDQEFGVSKATLRVYIYAQLVFENSGVSLNNSDLWKAATLAWPSGTVTPVKNQVGGYKITPNYPSPF